MFWCTQSVPPQMGGAYITEMKIAPRQQGRMWLCDIAVTVQIDGVEIAVHNGADAATVEAVLRAVKSC